MENAVEFWTKQSDFLALQRNNDQKFCTSVNLNQTLL